MHPEIMTKIVFFHMRQIPEMVAVHIFFELILTQERFRMVWSSLDLYVCVIVHRAMFVMAAPLSSHASVF